MSCCNGTDVFRCASDGVVLCFRELLRQTDVFRCVSWPVTCCVYDLDTQCDWSQFCFSIDNLMYQMVWIACRRGVGFQVVSACSRFCWSVCFALWAYFSLVRKPRWFITCVIYMWVSRAVSWVCYMCWWDWSVGHPFVRWSINFHWWESRSCQCLFLFTYGGVALYRCSAGDNLWDVDVENVGVVFPG